MLSYHHQKKNDTKQSGFALYNLALQPVFSSLFESSLPRAQEQTEQSELGAARGGVGDIALNWFYFIAIGFAVLYFAG